MWVELQQNSNAFSKEDYIPKILTVLLEIHRVYFWPLWPFVFCLSFNVTILSTNQCLWPGSGQILRHQCCMEFVPELQMFLHAKRPQLQRDGRNSCSFHRLLLLCLENLNISWGKATGNNENFGKQNVELASQGTSHKVTILIHSPLRNKNFTSEQITIWTPVQKTFFTTF